MSKHITPSLIASLLAISLTHNALAAPINDSAIQSYAASMKKAANAQNINQVANLVSDDALISLSRNGKTTSLDKSAYLRLLQNSWQNASDYKYDIKISNIVTTGDQAKADVTTVETWTKDGQKTTFTTQSRATLTPNNTGKDNAILLRAVSQITIN